jgi:hypothetical protein
MRRHPGLLLHIRTGYTHFVKTFTIGAFSPRRAALYALLAYLPSLLYVGHLDVRFEIPGIDGEWAPPLLSSGPAGPAHGHNEEATHAAHGHGGDASAADAQQVTALPAEILSGDALAVEFDDGSSAPNVTWTPGPDWDAAPPSPPPRTTSHA